MFKNRFTALSLLIIALGTGWMLTALKVIPDINWLWVAALGATGVLVIAVSGFDKVTAVFGPLLIAMSFFSILRQTGRIDFDMEVPALVITFGSLMFLSSTLPIRNPHWVLEAVKQGE